MDTLQSSYNDADVRESAFGSRKISPVGLPPPSVSDDVTASKALRLILVGFIAAGIVIRIVNLLLYSALWDDEIFSVALAESPLTDLVLATLRFDTHPPLYYIQLHFWAAFADSDRWYILNSTLLSIVSIAVMFETCRRQYNVSVGLWAAAIFAIMPMQIFFAENVRMYAMLAILQISLWHVLQTIIHEERASAGRLVAALCLGLAVTLTHGLGFFLTFFIFLQAVIWTFGRAPRRDFRLLVATYAIVALAALYPVAIGAIRQTEGVALFDLPHIGIHLTLTTLGMKFPWPTVAGFLFFPIITLLPLLERRARGISIMQVLLPAAVLLGISVLAKPVFIYRTLGLFLPFIAIALAIYADSVFRNRAHAQRLGIIVVMFIMLAGAVNYTVQSEKHGYRQIIAAWEASSEPDAIIMTSGPSQFWAVMRYLDNGAGKRSALDIQPPVRDGMLKMKEKLEAWGVGGIGLFGRSDYAVVGKRAVFPYFSDNAASKSQGFWILDSLTADCASPKTAATEGRVQYREIREIAADAHRLTECSVVR
jgi:mannosyltransferase